MLVYPRWRIRFNPPHETCVLPGFTRASLIANVRRDIKIKEDPDYPEYGRSCWQDPLTGVMMLRPNFFEDRFPEAFTPLSQWTHQANMWRESKRAMDILAADSSTVTPPLLSMTRPSDGSGPQAMLPVATDVTIAAISLLGQYQDDVLIPALQSTFTHPEDAGFILHARVHTDPLRRYKNWFGVRWGNYYLHVSFQGRAGLYRWADGDLSVPPVLFEEVELFDAGEVASKDHYFFILPIPNFGFCIYHSLSVTRLAATLSTAHADAMRGHLFRVPTESVGDGSYLRLNVASKIVIYLNKTFRVSHDVAFASLLFSPRGSFAGELFDIGQPRSSAPSSLNAQIIPSRPGITSHVTEQILGPDPETFWTTTQRQARFGVSMTRFDTYHSPFVYSTYVAWEPVRQLRNPGIVEMDDVPCLSFTQEDTGRWEGKAVVRAWSTNAKRLVERGDAYFIIERQDEEDGDWSVEFGGVARVEPGASAHIVNGQFEYQATWNLGDMTARLKEASSLWKTAFDGLSLTESTNTVLQAVGEPPLTSAPARFATLKIPATKDDSNWQNGPKIGDDGAEIMRKFLALGRRSQTEARLIYTWGSVTTGTGGQWSISDKPRDTTTRWSLTDKCDEEDLDARRIAIFRSDSDPSQLFTFSPAPPAANVLQVFGVEGSQPSKAQFLPGLPIENYKSLRTPASLEYLGRTVTTYPLVSGVNDTAVLDRIGRAVYDLACRWKCNLTVRLRDWPPELDWESDLTPATCIEGIRYEIYSPSESAWVMRELQWRDDPATDATRHYLWVRRRRVTQTHCETPARIELDLSTQWESGIDE